MIESFYVDDLVSGDRTTGKTYFLYPLPALLLAPFLARSLTLVPRSLLLNRTETLATQATKCFLRLRSMFGGSVSAKPP